MDLILETVGIRVSKKKELLKISTINEDPLKYRCEKLKALLLETEYKSLPKL